MESYGDKNASPFLAVPNPPVPQMFIPIPTHPRKNFPSSLLDCWYMSMHV